MSSATATSTPVESYDSRVDTEAHIASVARNLLTVISNLVARSRRHDQSKLESPERKTFDQVTPLLKGLTYGSDEYQASLAEMKPALDHHYALNAHHPEHWAHPVEVPEDADALWYDPEMVKSGEAIARMSLLDLVEMLCDWKAATERHADGDYGRSLKVNRERFGIGDQLFAVLVSTAKELGYIPGDWSEEG